MRLTRSSSGSSSSKWRGWDHPAAIASSARSMGARAVVELDVGRFRGPNGPPLPRSLRQHRPEQQCSRPIRYRHRRFRCRGHQSDRWARGSSRPGRCRADVRQPRPSPGRVRVEGMVGRQTVVEPGTEVRHHQVPRDSRSSRSIHGDGSQHPGRRRMCAEGCPTGTCGPDHTRRDPQQIREGIGVHGFQSATTARAPASTTSSRCCGCGSPRSTLMARGVQERNQVKCDLPCPPMSAMSMSAVNHVDARTAPTVYARSRSRSSSSGCRASHRRT